MEIHPTREKQVEMKNEIRENKGEKSYSVIKTEVLNAFS